ncbi:MAG: class I SAM-dependent methyltransferase [Actinomycetota bacterium]|nr:class I SAM-dependent methyltransferase [Actinomycetota bacterium]
MSGSSTVEPQPDLQTEVERHQWYHTFELAPGIETPGWFDLREIASTIPFPASLEGKRCLDVGTFDGFWAFEMEKRGGDVLAIDILDPLRWDWPAGAEAATIEAINQRKRGGGGFELVASTLGSAVERRELSVYELDPDDVGTFDLVYLGSLLIHLRDPVRALTRLREVCSGTAIICDGIDVTKSILFPREAVAGMDGQGRPWWWRPNVTGLERMVDAAGFRRLGKTQKLRMTPGRGMQHPPVSVASLRSRAAREQVFHSRLGDPHAVIVAAPR